MCPLTEQESGDRAVLRDGAPGSLDDQVAGLCCVDAAHSGQCGWLDEAHSRSEAACEDALRGFTGFGFPPEVILAAVRWYLRYGLSYRDLEELVAEGGIEVDRGTVYRWVQRFTPLLIDAARPARHLAGDRWFVDETSVKVCGVWSYVYRAVDQHGQVIDGYVSQRRGIASARALFTAVLAVHGDPAEVITDRAPALANAIEGVIPAVLHTTGQDENNRVECDHGRLKARLRPMRGLRTERTARVVIRGHPFIQNLRAGHYELAVDAGPLFRLATAFNEPRPAI